MTALTHYGRLVSGAGNYTVFYDEDEEDAPYLIYDGDMDCVDALEDEQEARQEAERLDRAATIEDLREQLQEALDEADDADDQTTLDRLTAALKTLRPEA